VARVTGDAFVARMAAGKAAAKARRAATGPTSRRQTSHVPRVPHEPDPVPVAFICNAIPALGLGLPSGLVSFDHGILELTDPRDIAAVRKHVWYGTRILECSGRDGPEERPAGTAVSTAEAVPVLSPPAASSPFSPYRRFMRQAEAGGWRCGICDMASPYFPTESAVLNHLFHQHRHVTTAPQAAQGGTDGTQ